MIKLVHPVLEAWENDPEPSQNQLPFCYVQWQDIHAFEDSKDPRYIGVVLYRLSFRSCDFCVSAFNTIPSRNSCVVLLSRTYTYVLRVRSLTAPPRIGAHDYQRPRLHSTSTIRSLGMNQGELV